MRLSIHLFQPSLWDLFQPSGLENLQTPRQLIWPYLKKNTHTVDAGVLYYIYCVLPTSTQILTCIASVSDRIIQLSRRTRAETLSKVG